MFRVFRVFPVSCTAPSREWTPVFRIARKSYVGIAGLMREASIAYGGWGCIGVIVPGHVRAGLASSVVNLHG